MVHLQFANPHKCKMRLASGWHYLWGTHKMLFWWLPSLSVSFYMQPTTFVLILAALCRFCDEPLWHHDGVALMLTFSPTDSRPC